MTRFFTIPLGFFIAVTLSSLFLSFSLVFSPVAKADDKELYVIGGGGGGGGGNKGADADYKAMGGGIVLGTIQNKGGYGGAGSSSGGNAGGGGGAGIVSNTDMVPNINGTDANKATPGDGGSFPIELTGTAGQNGSPPDGSKGGSGGDGGSVSFSLTENTFTNIKVKGGRGGQGGLGDDENGHGGNGGDGGSAELIVGADLNAKNVQVISGSGSSFNDKCGDTYCLGGNGGEARLELKNNKLATSDLTVWSGSDKNSESGYVYFLAKEVLASGETTQISIQNSSGKLGFHVDLFNLNGSNVALALKNTSADLKDGVEYGKNGVYIGEAKLTDENLFVHPLGGVAFVKRLTLNGTGTLSDYNFLNLGSLAIAGGTLNNTNWEGIIDHKYDSSEINIGEGGVTVSLEDYEDKTLTRALIKDPEQLDPHGGLTKTGSGKLTLSPSDQNTYSGDTLIQEGVLSLKNSYAVSGVNYTLDTPEATLELAYDGTFSKKILNSQPGFGELLVDPGKGNTLVFQTTDAFDGMVTVKSGTFQLDTNFYSPKLTLYGGATFDAKTNGKTHSMSSTEGVLTVVGTDKEAVYKGNLAAESVNVTIISPSSASSESILAVEGNANLKGATLSFVSSSAPSSAPMLLVEGDAILDDAVLQVGVRGNDKLVEGSALTLFRVDGSISAEGFAPGDTVPIKVGSTVISNIVLDPIFDGELSGGTFTGIVTYPPDSGDDEDPWSPPLTPPEEIDPKPEPGPDDGGGGGGDIGGDVTGNTASEESKALSEGFLGAIGLTSQGSDLIAFEGSPAAVRSADAAGAYSAAGFGAASGGVVRHNTGSYAETRGFSIMAGLAKGIDMTSGRLTLGVFAELGSGSYDTYNSFAGAIVEGDGDARYLGGGALFRMDFNSSRAKGGAYLEASARGGTLRNKYKSLDLKDISGVAAEYETSSGYYGFHLGAGYIWGISDRVNLDLYGKYFWTRQKGCETTLSTGEDLRFEDSDSSRIRVGGRISYAATRLISPYFGLAYERELQGKARVTTNGLPIDVPSLSGSTGVGELGFELSPGESFPLTFDLGAQGYTGKKEGVTGSIKINYVF